MNKTVKKIIPLTRKENIFFGSIVLMEGVFVLWFLWIW